MVDESPSPLRPNRWRIRITSGEVEAEETFIGGKARNMRASVKARKVIGTDGKDKTAVMDILERGGKVRTTVNQPSDRSPATVLPITI